jgi:gamma-glutamylcyclotransferase (GGCT)/AIG2-like uncharacterized protein YtfP
MKGLPFNDYLCDGEFVCQAKTSPEFSLIKLEYYPALVRVGNSSVEGELYLVNERGIRRLDHLERHPRFYKREVITMDDGQEAYAYLLPLVQSGNWREAARERESQQP